VRTYIADAASGRADPPSLTLISAGKQTPTRGLLRMIVQPGVYTLVVSPPPYIVEGGLGVLVSVELAIDTVNNINNIIYASPNPACVTSPFPAIMTDPNGYYQSGESLATIDPEELMSRDVIAEIPFSLDRYFITNK
jgi:hypothetical protein